MRSVRLSVVLRLNGIVVAFAIMGSLALASCGGGGGGGLKVGDCTDLSTLGTGQPKKLDCGDNNAVSIVTKVASGQGRSGTCPGNQTSVDDPNASGKYVCLKQK
jgi:hypothetical protein